MRRVKGLMNLQGKSLKATTKFKKGDVILEESPLLSCQFPWNAFYGYLSCHHCLRYAFLGVFKGFD